PARRRARQRRVPAPAHSPAAAARGPPRRGGQRRMSATTSTSTAASTRVELDINGTAADVRAGLATTLLTVLRDELPLTAAKRGCNQGVCGACTVEIDGVPMRACLSL